MAYIIFTYFVLTVITKLDAARILAVFPIPSISHQFVFRPLTQKLVKHGHEVVIITPDPAFQKRQSPENLTEIDVHDISYSVWQKELNKVAIGTKSDMGAQLKMFLDLYCIVIEQQILSKGVNDLITNRKKDFDLILTEACVRLTLIFSHIFKAPIIQVSSFGTMVGTNVIIGAPNHPLLQPIVFRQRLYNLTLWEKICEIYQQVKFEYIFYDHEQEENALLRKLLGPDTPTLSELCNNVVMVFLNVHWIWNDNQPVPPGVIYMGGLHQNPVKELPKALKSYLDSSKNGLIYMSFGTNVQSSLLPPDMIKMMMKVFSELPYNVIWKWDIDYSDKPKNVKIFNWLPQSDLLRHKNLKLFIMQGGLQSTDEAITAGVPMIGIPLMADQWFNIEKYVLHGIGKKLEAGVFTEEEFKTAIVTVIKDKSYRNNIIRLRTLIQDQHQTPLDRAVWWTEHVLRHGRAQHLRSPAANMSRIQYYELNLVLIILGFALLLYLFLCSFYIIYIMFSDMFLL